MPMKGGEVRFLRWSLVPKVVLVIMVPILAYLVLEQFHRHDAAQIDQWLHYQSETLRHAVRENYGHHLAVARRWQRYWQAVGLDGPDQACALLDAYRADNAEIPALALILGTDWYALCAEERMAWQEETSLPRRHLESLEQARISGALAIPHEFRLPGGGQGIYMYLPLQLGPDQPDLILIALEARRFMQRLQRQYFGDRPVRLLVRDDQRRVVFDSHPDLQATEHFREVLLDADGDGAPWTFVVMLLDTEMFTGSSARDRVVLIGAGAVFVLLLVVIRESLRRMSLIAELRRKQRLLEQEITERTRAQQRLEHLLYHNEMTGLPNRAALLRELAQCSEQSLCDHAALLKLQLLDLDRHQETYGYASLQQVIRSCAERLPEALQQAGLQGQFYALEQGRFACRLILDESASLLEAGQALVQALRAGEAWSALGYEPRLAVALLKLQGWEHMLPEQWLQQLDVALQQAVMMGDGGVVIYQRGMLERSRRRVELGRLLPEFLHENRFQLHYQPVYRLGDGREMHSIEAFLRLDHPDQGMLLPSVFLPLAEHNGFIRELDRWVVRQSLLDWQTLSERIPRHVRLELNLSLQSAACDRFRHWVLELLQHHGLAPERLCIDVCAHQVDAVVEQAGPALNEWQKVGVALALDVESVDMVAVGRNMLPCQWLKIDRSVVLGLFRDCGAEGVVHALMGLADRSGLQLVAEGVESARVARWLRDVGCQYAQGYHFLTPLPLHTLLDRLEEPADEPER